MCNSTSMMHYAPMNGQTYKKKTNPARKNVKSHIKTGREREPCNVEGLGFNVDGVV